MSDAPKLDSSRRNASGATDHCGVLCLRGVAELQIATTPSREWLIPSLKRRGIADLTPLEDPEVNEQNFIFALQRNRYPVDEEFFNELADELGLPFSMPTKSRGKSTWP